MRFRLVRSEGRRAVVEVEHLDVVAARALWTAAVDSQLSLRTIRTWGTLLGAKAWLRERRAPPHR